MSMKRKVIDREYIFDRSRVEFQTSCWTWVGRSASYSKKHPTGIVRALGPGVRKEVAHRAAYRVFVGSVPPGMVVCHRCDNSLCVNPAHLFVGTQKDNMEDCCRKGRQNRWARNGQAKLTIEAVLEMRRLRGLGFSTNALASRFNIDRAQVSRIVRNQAWRDLPSDR